MFDLWFSGLETNSNFRARLFINEMEAYGGLEVLKDKQSPKGISLSVYV